MHTTAKAACRPICRYENALESRLRFTMIAWQIIYLITATGVAASVETFLCTQIKKGGMLDGDLPRKRLMHCLQESIPVQHT